MLLHAAAAGMLIFVSLGSGTIGYRFFCQLDWDDAFLNASMILTGMGPVNPMRDTGAKVFASLYALYSGIAFLTMAALLLAPLLHRFLHRFHLDEERNS